MASDDQRIAEIRELLAEVNTPVGYFPDMDEALDWAFALAGRIDALTAERDVLRVERDIARRVEQESSAAADAWQAEAVKVRTERDALTAERDAQRAIMGAQAGVSEQHRKRVQELAGEVERLQRRSRDEDTARIRLNHARIEAEAEVARLQALLAERDARIDALAGSREQAATTGEEG